MGDIVMVLALGLAAGILGGFVGVGGGVLIVPVLVLVLGFDQHLAVGTSLGALLPPVGILGAYSTTGTAISMSRTRCCWV